MRFKIKIVSGKLKGSPIAKFIEGKNCKASENNYTHLGGGWYSATVSVGTEIYKLDKVNMKKLS